MKIGIIGGGITGLSIAQLLHKDFDVQILEKENYYGGIAHTKSINGITYHTVGGHCFNSKHKDVLDFVFSKVLPQSEWREIKRISKIQIQDFEIDYPIEFSVKQIHKFNPQLAIKIAVDFLNSKDDGHYENLECWFRKKFGETLANIYFIPYNSKLWGINSINMNCEWVKDKLPIPTKEMFLNGLISEMVDSMPHSIFYYPASNNMKSFIDALAKNINIKNNTNVTNIRFSKVSKKWILNDIFEYDILINTSPLNELPIKLENVPDCIIEAAKKLKYNSISTVLWKTAQTNKTWTYLPDPNNIFHRYIHIGNYFYPQTPYSISETQGKIDYNKLVSQDKNKNSFLIEAIDYHQSEHAYVLFDKNYANNRMKIKDYLKELELYSIGRFGDWEYYNMDICIKQSIELAKKIKRNYEQGVTNSHIQS